MIFCGGMKICRYDDDRVGIVRDGLVFDATAALEALPARRWPAPLGDDLIGSLDSLRPALERAAQASAPTDIGAVRLSSPVANPTKLIGAPVNYALHLAEARGDAALHHGAPVHPVEKIGLFLKATSALVGPHRGVSLRFTDRRTDHEVELAVVIGRVADRVSRAHALSHVAGYTIGLDMTVRGPEERSYRKSIDSYAVLGPWLVTADEIADPNELDLALSVNGEERQRGNTRQMLFDVPRLIEYASSVYTLYPGDVLFTGTPDGVGPVSPGDRIEAYVERIGTMSVRVEAAV